MEVSDIIAFIYKAMETEMIVTTNYSSITIRNPKNGDSILYIWVDDTKIIIESIPNRNTGSYNITKEEYNKFIVLMDDIKKYSQRQFEFEFSQMVKEMDSNNIDD